MLFKHDREMALLDTIYSYNPGLSREIAKDFVQNSYQGIETVLFKKLLHVTEAFQKMLLLIVIDCFKPEGDYVLQHLRSYLAEQHDDNITFLTIRTLGHLKDEHSLNKFLYYLESPNEKIVEAALISINDLARNKSIKTDNFLDIVIQNNLVQRLLTDSRYIFVLNQLGIPDLQKLAGHENPDFRYLAAIYSGIVGHGELMDLLNSLLGDPAAINIANDHGHTTVSSGALHSLNRIGSPSAKSYVDSWQQNKIL
jgi:HEAT repeat protein